MAEVWRRSVLHAAQKLGAEGVLRQAQRALETPLERRDRRDREHLRLLMRLSLATDADCVDIGANVGDVLAEMVQVAPYGHHVAFEPLPELASSLRRRFPQVDVHNAAVGASSMRAVFYRVRSAHSRSSLSPAGLDPSDLDEVEVQVAALDEALDDKRAPALIKIDVEGGELGVFHGARQTLSTHHPIVVFEHGASARAMDSGSTRKIHAFLADLGYRIFDIDGTGPLGEAQFEAVACEGRVWTFVTHR